MMHVLGFRHEHNREERDKYVKIIWKNIEESKKKNFRISYDLNNFSVPYDIHSLLHYGSSQGIKKDIVSRFEALFVGKYSILTKDGKVIHRSNELSFKDEAKIRIAYNCKLTVHPCP